MPEGLKNYLMKKGKKKDEKEKEVKEQKIAHRSFPAKPAKPVKGSDQVKPEIKSDKPVPQMSGVDLFDLVKGKLIDEGVDEKEALKIMISLSEEQLQQIVEMDKMGGPAAIATILGAGLAGGKKLIDGVRGMGKKLQQKTQEKNKMMQGM